MDDLLLGFRDWLPSLNVNFTGNNNLQYIDQSGSRLSAFPRMIYGLTKPKYLNLQNTALGENIISFTVFEDMPHLKLLLLGNTKLSYSISSDDNFTLFKALVELEILDLASCSVTRLPHLEMFTLTSLTLLNLLLNFIEHLDIALRNVSYLKVLNLSLNQITKFSDTMRLQFDLPAVVSHRPGRLVVDLS